MREIDPDEVAGFVKRAQELLATGDLQAGRLLLLRAAEARNARAALLLAPPAWAAPTSTGSSPWPQ